MVIWTARVHKRRIIVLLLLAALAALALVIYLFIGLRDSGEPQTVQLAANEDRVAYLATWGWEVRNEPVETFQLLLPEELQEPYLSYNELQKGQGFDLSTCCGRQVIRYTYTVTNYPDRPEGVQANLYTCENTPVAGDIMVTGSDGFQAGLQYPAKQ